MAQKITLLSDLSGKPDASTVTFGVAGVNYEMDLTESEQTAFAKVLAPYVDKARVVVVEETETTPQSDAPAIRAWARSKGLKVSERGRLSSDIVAAFEAAQTEEAEQPA